MHPSPQAFVIAAMDPSPSNGVSTKCKGPVSGCRSLQASAQSPTKLRSPSGPWQNWTNSSSAVLKYRLLPGSNPSQPGARRSSSTICFAAGVINPSATRAPVMCPWRPHAPARVGGMSNRRIRIRFTSYSLRQMGGSMPSCSPAFFLYLLHGTFNPFRNELREWADIHVDARAVQRLQIDGTILHQDHSPGIAPRRERGVHEKTGYPSVTVRIGVHITEEPVTEDGSYARLRLILQQIKQLRDRIAYCFPTGRHIPRCAQVNRVIAVAGQLPCRNQASRDTGLK